MEGSVEQIVRYEIIEGDVNVADVAKKLRIKVPGSVVEAMVDREASGLLDARFKGFPRGGMPPSMVKSIVRSENMRDITDKIAYTVCQMICSEHKLMLVDNASYQVAEFTPDLIFSLDMRAIGDFPVPNIADIEIRGYECEITDADAQKEIERLMSEVTFYAPAADDAVVELNDSVLLTTEAKIGDKTVKDLSVTKRKIVISNNADSTLLSIPQNAIGMRKNENKTVTLDIPGTYKSKSFRNRQAVVELSVEDIERKAPAKDLNDFLARVGASSEGDLRSVISGDLKNRAMRYGFELQTRELKDKIYELCDFELPGYQAAENETEEQKTKREKDKKDAIVSFVSSKYAMQNNIEVTSADMERALRTQLTGDEARDKMIMNFYRANPKILDQLRSSVAFGKSMEYMVHVAKKISVKKTLDELKNIVEESKVS